MSKDIKKALEHCVEWNCDNCPNREELGSGEIVCRGRLLPEVLEYVADLEAKLKNAIVSKFKVGQEVWFVSDPYTARYAKVRHMKIEEISISSIFVERGVMYAGDDWAGISESELFATKAEAQAKLKELGEKK